MLASFVVGGIVVLSLSLGGTAQAQSSCDAGVTKALAKKVSCKLKVFAAAQKSGTPVDTVKLTKCEGKFASSCAKARSKGDCQAQTATCDALEAMADAAVDDLNGALPTTTTSTSTTTTTLDPFRSCGRDPGGTCGGFCDGVIDQCVQDDQTGACVCVSPPCQPIGGIGSCRGSCPSGETCTFTGDPSFPCACFP
jgi:hypothetical protein